MRKEKKTTLIKKELQKIKYPKQLQTDNMFTHVEDRWLDLKPPTISRETEKI